MLVGTIPSFLSISYESNDHLAGFFIEKKTSLMFNIFRKIFYFPSVEFKNKEFLFSIIVEDPNLDWQGIIQVT